MKRALAAISLAFLMVVSSATVATAKSDKAQKVSKTTESRTLYSYSSVHPFIVHALNGCQCRWVDDEFEQRDCKKRCVPFKKKMLAWAAKNPVLHHDLELDVQKYNFKSRAYVLKREDLLVEPDRVPGSVIIGSGRCDSMTGMPMTSQRIVAKMKEKEAKRSVLRGADDVSATAVLHGKVSTMNWCCDAYTRREASMDGVSCNGRVFKYTIKEVAVGELPWWRSNDEQSNNSEELGDDQDSTRPWRMGFKTPVESIDFEPSMIGFEEYPGELDD
ncbi:MAG: hypothetical protein CL940_12195 [Deltaproteobacteria bacterium]|nr:hypothetical protein [Deltaproteobacteria bacterium]